MSSNTSPNSATNNSETHSYASNTSGRGGYRRGRGRGGGPRRDPRVLFTNAKRSLRKTFQSPSEIQREMDQQNMKKYLYHQIQIWTEQHHTINDIITSNITMNQFKNFKPGDLYAELESDHDHNNKETQNNKLNEETQEIASNQNQNEIKILEWYHLKHFNDIYDSHISPVLGDDAIDQLQAIAVVQFSGMKLFVDVYRDYIKSPVSIKETQIHYTEFKALYDEIKTRGNEFSEFDLRSKWNSISKDETGVLYITKSKWRQFEKEIKRSQQSQNNPFLKMDTVDTITSSMSTISVNGSTKSKSIKLDHDELTKSDSISITNSSDAYFGSDIDTFSISNGNGLGDLLSFSDFKCLYFEYDGKDPNSVNGIKKNLFELRKHWREYLDPHSTGWITKGQWNDFIIRCFADKAIGKGYGTNRRFPDPVLKSRIIRPKRGDLSWIKNPNPANIPRQSVRQIQQQIADQIMGYIPDDHQQSKEMIRDRWGRKQFLEIQRKWTEQANKQLDINQYYEPYSSVIGAGGTGGNGRGTCIDYRGNNVDTSRFGASRDSRQSTLRHSPSGQRVSRPTPPPFIPNSNLYGNEDSSFMNENPPHFGLGADPVHGYRPVMDGGFRGLHPTPHVSQSQQSLVDLQQLHTPEMMEQYATMIPRPRAQGSHQKQSLEQRTEWIRRRTAQLEMKPYGLNGLVMEGKETPFDEFRSLSMLDGTHPTRLWD